MALQRFYAELTKTNGNDYEPESLKVMLAALDRHVREHSVFSIMKDITQSIEWKSYQYTEERKGKASK